MVRAFRHVRRSATFLAALAISATTSSAQGLPDRLLIHGYLTQGYATTKGEMLLGIPSDGTFDYRRVALLFRFKATTNDAFVVQFANRRLGESPINDATPDVQLDWAFYERRLGDNASLRIGKAPIPMGISNETRYQGTQLPFYRVPFGFYQEGGFTSETLNGAVFTRKLNPGSVWLLTASIFAGEFDYLQAGAAVETDSSQAAYLVAPARARNLLGTQLWLQTPLTGLRVGAGAARREDEGFFSEQISGSGATKDLWASIDGNFDRLTTRAEYRRLAFGSNGALFKTDYEQVGYRIIESLLVTVQRDATDLVIPVPAGKMKIPYDRDVAIGVAYTFVPNVVGKFEFHDADGYNVEAVTNYLAPPLENQYIILSLSVAF
jgi:hypothetical protein